MIGKFHVADREGPGVEDTNIEAAIARQAIQHLPSLRIAQAVTPRQRPQVIAARPGLGLRERTRAIGLQVRWELLPVMGRGRVRGQLQRGARERRSLGDGSRQRSEHGAPQRDSLSHQDVGHISCAGGTVTLPADEQRSILRIESHLIHSDELRHCFGIAANIVEPLRVLRLDRPAVPGADRVHEDQVCDSQPTGLVVYHLSLGEWAGGREVVVHPDDAGTEAQQVRLGGT